LGDATSGYDFLGTGKFMPLKGKGLLRRIGLDKGGHWEVVVNEENFAQKSIDHQSLIDTRNPGIQKE